MKVVVNEVKGELAMGRNLVGKKDLSIGDLQDKLGGLMVENARLVKAN